MLERKVKDSGPMITVDYDEDQPTRGRPGLNLNTLLG